jgi:tellurite resistance protein TerC
MMHEQTLLWVGFVGIIIIMLALDLGIFQRGKQVMSIKESLIWCGVWAGLAMLCNVGVFLFHPRGTDAGLEFFTGYVTEQSLSVDNIFVFLVLFGYFKVPRVYQHKVLFWGVLGAVIFRGIFILGGLALISRFHWMIYVFGGFLVLTGTSMVWKDQEKEIHPEKNLVMRAFRRCFRVTPDYHRDRFFFCKNGKLWVTPLLMVLIAVESTDIVFATDSIPAIFAITPDPFLIFSSNILALIGIRSLYFAVAGFMRNFYFLHYGFASILVMLGTKMLLSHVVQVPIALSLVLIIFILLLCVIISLLRPRKADLKQIFGRAAQLGLIPFRHLLVIENMMDHADKPVREVMRPRSSVAVIRLNSPWKENARLLRETRFSRYPIVEADGARPLGILHVMDLALAETRQEPDAAQLKELARSGLALREDLSLTETAVQFRRHSNEMGIILDPGGEWTGIVTLEDLFEEIFGEIEDESSIARAETPMLIGDALSPGRIVLNLQARSMPEAIENIIGAIPKQELPIESQTMLRALMQRAPRVPTYLEEGVAVPHARLEGLDQPMLVFARSEEGVELDANQHAQLFFLALCPMETPNLEVRLLASITRLIDSEFVLHRLREAQTPEEVIETIRIGERLLPV